MSELFDSLYRQHKETVYKYILVSLDFNHDLADDCMQDIFLLLMQKQAEISVHPNPGGFLIVTARNFIKRYKTTQYNHGKRLVPLQDKVSTLIYHETFPDMLTPLPDTESMKKNILNRLNDNEINLYDCFYERGFSIADIAKRLNISENNVKVRLYRLRLKVKQIVQELFS